MEKTEKRLEGSKKKLLNENFVNRAAPEVVERERSLVNDLEKELVSIQTNLDALNSSSS
jgi:valyl-tRNA synthetase